MAGIEFFKEAAEFLRVVWRVICRIARIIAFILACLFGASVPISILMVCIWIIVGD